jgi:glycosyltransferase involved in cell wall biosynthesis
MEALFWLGFGGVAYAYLGYPLVLLVWGSIRSRPAQKVVDHSPSVSVILPAHNEAAQLPARLDRLRDLQYPTDRLEIIVVSDGSTDATPTIVRRYAEQDGRIRLVELKQRGGKGNAINRGIAQATHDIIVFTDAGITLDLRALEAIVAAFADPTVGCVSGEDRIAELGGEGLYGRYELFLRRQESRIHSIVGASGSFYAQRKLACPTFPEGLAPDFLSVLHAVELGFRAVNEPGAGGEMKALTTHRDEFRRKVRTILRGMTALFHYKHLLNPYRFGAFAFFLFSHKLMRWLVPGFLVAMIVANVALLHRPFYAAVAIPHALFYAVGGASVAGLPSGGLLPARIAGYLLTVNSAIAVAWWHFLRGRRTEVWVPTRRS